jgi:ferredoxin-like protein FixX
VNRVSPSLIFKNPQFNYWSPLQYDNLRPFIQIKRSNPRYVRPQVAMNTWTSNTHQHTQVKACPVRICNKINSSRYETLLHTLSRHGYEKIGKESLRKCSLKALKVSMLHNTRRAIINIVMKWGTVFSTCWEYGLPMSFISINNKTEHQWFQDGMCTKICLVTCYVWISC